MTDLLKSIKNLSIYAINISITEAFSFSYTYINSINYLNNITLFKW